MQLYPCWRVYKFRIDQPQHLFHIYIFLVLSFNYSFLYIVQKINKNEGKNKSVLICFKWAKKIITSDTFLTPAQPNILQSLVYFITVVC